MSDFDKEAEREKLREKYERDKEDRKATQRMSDLLLKGATMTNAHCGTCGDPLFQQDGTTFCPSCHGNPDAVQGTELEAQPSEEQASEERQSEGRPADGRSTHEESAETRQSDDERTPTGADDDRSDAANGSTPTDAGTDSRSDLTRAESADEPSSAARRRSDERRRSETGATPSSFDGDLDGAHGALVRTLEKFAEEAAETDDPRYAKECLEAAREASETLAALRRSNAR